MLQKIGGLITRNRRFIPLTATILLALAAYGVGMIFMPGMRNPQVFFNIFRNNSFLIISAVGMTFVILTGGIDLSVSGVIALTTVATAALLRAGWNAWVVIPLMLLMGMALGAVMGSFIAYMKVQPFIATLAGTWFARGMCFFISDDAIAINNRTFDIIGKTKIMIPGWMELAAAQGTTAPFISIPVVVAMLVFLIAIFIAHYTRFGRTVYAIGGNEGRNEQSARLMGLPVETTKMLVYTLNGFCSALAGIFFSIFVSSGHGLYATNFEMDAIASVVMGGTMLTGGSGYVFGTLFGSLIFGITQTLIQFNGTLSSWWTRIVIGVLTLLFIGVQSVLANQKRSRKTEGALTPEEIHLRNRRRVLVYGGGTIIAAAVLGVFLVSRLIGPSANASVTEEEHCTLQPYRQDRAAQLLEGGALLVYERNGGPACVDELYAVYGDGKITGDNVTSQINKEVTTADVNLLLGSIAEYGWFTDDLYDTWHNPCGQCYGYYLTVSYQGQVKTVKGVDGGTDAPADYWQIISLVKGIIPQFP
jgi:simple sugar transport system permease protein